jgi:hypothetical protein
MATEDVIHRQGRGEMKYEVLQEIKHIEDQIHITDYVDVVKSSQLILIKRILKNLEKL